MNKSLSRCGTSLKMRLESYSNSTAAWCVLLSVGAAFLEWDGRYAMDPDGVAYLDMASATLKLGPLSLVNGHWGPLYPALIAVFLRLLRPSPSGEYLALHFLNWLIFVGATLAFGFFLKNWLLQNAGSLLDLEPERKRALVPFAFVLFFFTVSELVGVSATNPDMLVVAFVFLSAGIGCRLMQPSSSPRHAAAFGLLLALGYYAKPSGFVVAFFALVSFLGFVWPERRARNQVGIAAAVFVTFSAPFVVLMTQHVGKLSIGENGTVNYLTHVSKTDYMELVLSGKLAHPPKVLVQRPPVLEFASPLSGVFPLHDEPTYWIAGIPIHFSLWKQIVAIRQNLRIVHALLLTLSAAWGGVFSLLVFALASGKKLRNPSRNQYWLIAWSLGVCGTYLLVYIEVRYIAPFVILMCLAAYRAVMGNIERKGECALLLAVSLAMVIPACESVAMSGVHLIRDLRVPRESDSLVIADAIRRAGLNPGDYVAVVGEGFSVASYARLAGVRIEVQTPDDPAFWRLSQSEMMEVRNRLREAHVKAILTTSSTPCTGDRNWTEVEGLQDAYFRISSLSEAP